MHWQCIWFHCRAEENTFLTKSDTFQMVLNVGSKDLFSRFSLRNKNKLCVFSKRLQVTKSFKIQFKTVSLPSCLVCVDTTLVHLMR